jgi:hypothetical protein
MSGGGTDGKITGAVVGNSISFTGNTKFFYDESLGRINFGNPYGASKWRELQSATERAAYGMPLGF